MTRLLWATRPLSHCTPTSCAQLALRYSKSSISVAHAFPGASLSWLSSSPYTARREVVIVQPYRIQRQTLLVQLVAYPLRSVHDRHLVVCPVQTHAPRVSTHYLPSLFAVLARHRHQPVL